ncbi:MAG: SMI1/KNR4 family protein [Armatimonadetes bacterium]|nr:SMI1/KNR4 family protein [Armatimonadota bacterium]
MAKRVEEIFEHDDDFYGEIRFFDPAELPEHLPSCKSWAEAFEEDPDPAQKAFWLNALPFHSILNGDYLGLDISTTHDDPPVVYLAHDDKSQVIAPSFTSFLQSWAGLCYIGPERWKL